VENGHFDKRLAVVRESAGERYQHRLNALVQRLS
jgi:hypothetical protein